MMPPERQNESWLAFLEAERHQLISDEPFITPEKYPLRGKLFSLTVGSIFVGSMLALRVKDAISKRIFPEDKA